MYFYYVSYIHRLLCTLMVYVYFYLSCVYVCIRCKYCHGTFLFTKQWRSCWSHNACMYVCMYVCMYILYICSMYVCMYCMYILYIFMYVCIYVHTVFILVSVRVLYMNSLLKCCHHRAGQWNQYCGGDLARFHFGPTTGASSGSRGWVKIYIV